MYKSKSLNFISVIFLFVLISFYNGCTTPQETEGNETVEFESTADENGFQKSGSKKTLPFLDFVKELEASSDSFQGDFSLKITRYDTPEKLNVNGKIFFEKEGRKLKIQLMDPFFGMIISQILADPNTIRIKSSGASSIHSQEMSDLTIKDPQTQKNFRIPFPVLFQTIALNFTEDFQKKDTLIHPEDKKVKLQKSGDEYFYTFYEGGLDSLEYISKEKSLQAKTKVSESAKKGAHPPEKLLTRVTDAQTGKDLSLVETRIKNIKKMSKIPDSTFRF
ncbi:MAG: hypothetical protein H7A24_07090 [Leptospiraceae bacterium]|nr:hypothetical protein [Leptospiraceae bacterium]MCP5511629.1 hypothetical protein [Leptospiraceae bacterium]